MKLTVSKNFANVLRDSFSISADRVGLEPFVVFESSDNGKYLYAQNKINFILCRFDVSDCVSTQETGKVVITKRVSDFLNFYTQSFPVECIIEFEESNINVVINGRKVLVLNTVEANTDLFSIESSVIEIIDTDFNIKNIIQNACRFTDNSTVTNPAMQGVMFDIKDDTISISATNGNYAYVYSNTIKYNSEPFKKVIYGKALRDVSRFFEPFVKISSNAGVVYFESGRITARINEIECNPLPIDRVLSRKGERDAKIDVEDVYNAVLKTSIACDKTNLSTVVFNIAENKIDVSAGKSEIGSAQIPVSCKYNKTPTKIIFSTNYLLECLSALSERNVVMFFNETTPVLFEEKNVKIVVMPCSEL